MLDYKVLVHYHNPTGDYFSYDMAVANKPMGTGSSLFQT